MFRIDRQLPIIRIAKTGKNWCQAFDSANFSHSMYRNWIVEDVVRPVILRFSHV